MSITDEAPGQPRPNDRPPAAASGMKSSLKVLVPLVVLVGVVFGVTVLLLYTPPDAPGPDTPGSGEGATSPLLWFTSSRQWDPGSDRLQDRYFPGFFEKNAEAKTAFWFENRNDKAVVMQLKNVSCSACSGGSLAPIPPASVRNILEMVAVSSLPVGLAPPLPIGMAGVWADTVPKLEWQSHKFATMDWHFTVPAANPEDRWSPTQWGILDLHFGTGGRSQLEATFATQIQDSKQFAEDTFKISFAVVNPFGVYPQAIDVGVFNERDREPQAREFVVFSSTRGPGALAGDLPVPACAVRMPGGVGEPGQFVTIGTPVPIPQDVCERLSEQLSPAGGSVKTRVSAAYRVPVRITPEAGGDRLDIGLLEREIWVTLPGTGVAEQRVKVTGVVKGSVWLDGKEVALGTFKGAEGKTERVRLTTERPGMELAVVADQCRPDFLDVSLKKLPDDPDRGYYQLTVKVPPNRHFGTIVNGLVVLELKGPKPQRIRIPVTGQGGF